MESTLPFKGSGLYYYDPASVAREGIIWDVIDLCLALPLFIVAIVLTWRGSLRGQLLLGGMLFYFFYKYMQYAVLLAFNPLFLVYVAIFALSAVAFFVNLGGIKVSSLPKHISAHFPRWLFIVFTLVMSAALIVLWLGRIIPYTLAGHFPDELAGQTTLVTQAFDLGIVVPLLLSTAVLLWRRSIWGYFLGGISLTFGFVMCITLPAWIVVPLISGGADEYHRSRSISPTLPGWIVCCRAVLLECAGKGNGTIPWRNGSCLIAFTVLGDR